MGHPVSLDDMAGRVHSGKAYEREAGKGLVRADALSADFSSQLTDDHDSRYVFTGYGRIVYRFSLLVVARELSPLGRGAVATSSSLC